MKVDAPMSTIRFRLRSVGLTVVVLVTAISLMACVAAIPVAIYYFKAPNAYVAQADTKRSADEVYALVAQLTGEAKAEGRVEILDRDDEKRMIKITDGVQIAAVKVMPLDKRTSRINVVADVPSDEEGEEDKETELAARIMKRLCEEANAKCEFVEEEK